MGSKKECTHSANSLRPNKHDVLLFACPRSAREKYHETTHQAHEMEKLQTEELHLKRS